MKYLPDDYIKRGGVCCPSCGSDGIQGQAVEIDAGGATQKIDCLACASSWIDNYQLIGYVCLEEDDPT